MEQILIDTIRLDTSKIQLSNRRIDESQVQLYVEALTAGAEFPPIVVFRSGEDLWLADGFHRLAASRFLGHSQVLADVREGTHQDAMVFAATANVTNGRPMTQAQKREAGKRLLKLTDWSDREIARKLAITHPSVAQWRQSLSGKNLPDKPIRTVTRGGTTYPMNTAKIGNVIQSTLTQPEQPETESPTLSGSMQLILGDFAEVAQTLEPASFDVIITDPPYPKEFLYLYDVLAEQAARLLKPNGVLLAMAGGSYLPYIMTSLSEYLQYRWTLAYLVPAPHVQVWDRKILCGWKPVFVFTPFDGKYQKWAHDTVKSPQEEKEHHAWGQSVAGMMELVKRFTEAGDLVLDPFLGGGSTAVACLKLSRRFVGIDTSQEAIHETRKHLEENKS